MAPLGGGAVTVPPQTLEFNEGDVQAFLNEEIRHPLDLRSQNKLAITYPHLGEEKQAVEAIKNMVQRWAILASDVFEEKNLVVFGFSTWREGKRPIQWKGYFIDRKGEVEDRESVVPQRS